MTTKFKYLSSIAEDVVKLSAQKLDTSVEKLVEEFEDGWTHEMGNYCKRLVEFCSGKVVSGMFRDNTEEKVHDGSFIRLTYDMMLSWERPCYYEEEPMESVAKEKEERKITVGTTQEHDDLPLFYSDIMPLLVNNEPNVGEDAFVWFGSLVPLVADVANGRFTFETLTASTGHRLYFPAYNMFIKEVYKCIRHLQKQATPIGVELADDEYVLHMEGTTSSQRVVLHIGQTSWPGRLTLSNYALYFEASGVIKYEDALRIDLFKDTEQIVKPAATGPWGAPLFDKAIVYNSTDLAEGIVLEFPELASSTRRDHWLALIKEIMLLHQFFVKFNIKCPIQKWEMHARSILGIIRLHAARELLRISPPIPTQFLIFSLYNEIPKGDYVLEELAESLNKINSGHPCSASSILRSMNIFRPIISNPVVIEEDSQENESSVCSHDSPLSLEAAIKRAREEEKETLIAKVTTEELKEEGVIDSALVLMELMKPLRNAMPWFQGIFCWERPITTLAVLVASLIMTYMEWIGKAIAISLMWVIVKMLEARKNRIYEKYNELVICTASKQSTAESVMLAQQRLYTVHDMVHIANLTMLKIWSILASNADKHANTVMVAMSGLVVLFAVVSFKFILMGIILQIFIMASKTGKSSGIGNRRLKEWWDSIPVIPVRVVDNVANTE